MDLKVSDVIQTAADVLKGGHWCILSRASDDTLLTDFQYAWDEGVTKRCALGALDYAFHEHGFQYGESTYSVYDDHPLYLQIIEDLMLQENPDEMGLPYQHVPALVAEWNNDFPEQVAEGEPGQPVIDALETLAEGYRELEAA